MTKRTLSILAAAALAAACTSETPEPAATSAPAAAEAMETAPPVLGGTKSTETPADFVTRINEEFDVLSRETAAASWVRANFITTDTARLAAKAGERRLAALSDAVEQSKAFNGQDMDPASARSLHLLKLETSMPAPNDDAKRAELTQLQTDMAGMYGAGKWCTDEGECKDLEELNRIMANSRDYDELKAAWTGWRTVSPPMRPMYQRFAELTEEGAQTLGFSDLGTMWRSAYDMTPEEFAAEAERLWSQVDPLYEQLHCYVRDELADYYGEDKVSRTGPIPAHLLGNMWSQQWGEIYDLVEPYPGETHLDVTETLKTAGYDEEKMVRTAEAFFVSLGMPDLPDTFYERSLIKKPADRDVICHASAWDMNPAEKDVRIKQCVEINEEQFVTLHHELGHIYYYLAYNHQPNLFRSGAHDGFHEGIGDTLNLSMTPDYYARLGLVEATEANEKAVINQQMKLALDKIAFLPFGKLIDQWRWGVFDGSISPEDYNKAWWELRTKYQGIEAPVERSEADFDPGAKYHVPGNTPYTRYFLAHILQFQFHKALCDTAGHEGDLYGCSIYGSKAAGEQLWAMMQAGISQPWQETLQAAIGTDQMDASAIIDYFAPLMGWLEEQNQGKTCGW
mgnify:FL=1|jgi:peptidyl-dipeptidase A